MNLFILLQLFVLSFIDQLLHYVELLDFPFVYTFLGAKAPLGLAHVTVTVTVTVSETKKVEK